MTVSPFTLLVSGPISSRFTELVTLQTLIDSFILVKEMNALNRIFVSTYDGDFPVELNPYVDRVLFCKDPGPDNYRVDPWPIGNNERRFESNTSRMLECTNIGLSHIETALTIKTRVELLPENSKIFSAWYQDIASFICESDEPLIAILHEHFSGISFSINGILGMLPDTFQLAKTETLQKIWFESQIFWKKYLDHLIIKKYRFPISPEQVIGLNFLELYANFDLKNEFSSIRRYYTSLKLIKSQIFAEKKLYILQEYKNSGMSVNYFAGTLKIDTSHVYNLDSKFESLCAFVDLLAKRFFHHYRRYLHGFIKNLFLH